jgi:hypothetical protein
MKQATFMLLKKLEQSSASHTLFPAGRHEWPLFSREISLFLLTKYHFLFLQIVLSFAPI